MKIFVGIILGFFSAFLVYMATMMLFSSGEPSYAFVFVTFFGGWILSTWVLVCGARTVLKVFSRGFLLGAAEWLAMVPVGVVFSGKALTQTVTQGGGTNAELAGATIGAGLVSFITGGVSVVMALVCLIGFAISYFIGREMGTEVVTPTRTCPECTELIQVAARKCKHCGVEIPQVGGKKMKCLNCSYEISEGSKNCPRCGSNAKEGCPKCGSLNLKRVKWTIGEGFL